MRIGVRGMTVWGGCVGVVLMLGGVGCAGGGDADRAVLAGGLGVGDVVVDASAYPRLFASAKAELRARGFVLDRVDARSGVITTEPLLSGGVFTPWVGGAGVGAAVDDTLHRNERVVRVVFSRTTVEGRLSVDAASWPGSGGAADLRLWPGGVSARVEVDVLRAYEPGRRADANSIRLNHRVRTEGGGAPAGSSVLLSRVGSDRELATSLLSGIAERGGVGGR